MNGSSSNSLRLLLNIFADFQAQDRNVSAVGGEKKESSPPQVSRLDNVSLAVAQMWYDFGPHSRHRPRGADPALRLASYSELWTGFHRRAVLWAAAMTAAFEPVLKVELTCAKKINRILLKQTLTASYILTK